MSVSVNDLAYLLQRKNIQKVVKKGRNTVGDVQRELQDQSWSHGVESVISIAETSTALCDLVLG